MDANKQSKPNIDELFVAMQDFHIRNIRCGYEGPQREESLRLIAEDLKRLGIADMFDWSKDGEMQETRFKAMYQGVVIGWYDTLTEASAAIDAAMQDDTEGEESIGRTYRVEQS